MDGWEDEEEWGEGRKIYIYLQNCVMKNSDSNKKNSKCCILKFQSFLLEYFLSLVCHPSGIIFMFWI